MPGLERKIATGLRRLRQIEQRQPVRDVHYYRAEFARMDRQATDMAKAGEISIQQASTLDNLLHRYAMEHLL
jgi:hypothetical protein